MGCKQLAVPSQNGVVDCRLSRDPVHEFPLAIVGMNITGWTEQLLQQGNRPLQKAALHESSTWKAASQFYIGAFYAWYQHWRDNKCTMTDSGFVMKQIESHAKSKVAGMIQTAITASGM